MLCRQVKVVNATSDENNVALAPSNNHIKVRGMLVFVVALTKYDTTRPNLSRISTVNKNRLELQIIRTIITSISRRSKRNRDKKLINS